MSEIYNTISDMSTETITVSRTSDHIVQLITTMNAPDDGEVASAAVTLVDLIRIAGGVWARSINALSTQPLEDKGIMIQNHCSRV